MKLTRVLLSSAAIVVMAGAAHAADLVVDVPVAEPIAVADTGWYFSVFAGGVWDGFNTTTSDDFDDIDIDSDMGWSFGAAVGTHLMDNLRGEIELSGTSRDGSTWSQDGNDGDIVNGTATTVSLLGNLWFDFDTGSGFTPYVGGGVGVGFVSAQSDVPDTDVDGVGIAYQVGAGVKFDVADNVAIDLGYRFKGVSADVDGTFGGAPIDDVHSSIGSHVLQVGVTFGF